MPHQKALEIRDDIAFFQAVRSALAKSGAPSPKPEEDLDHAIRQLVSKAVATDQVIDKYAAAGLKKPDIDMSFTDWVVTQMAASYGQKVVISTDRRDSPSMQKMGIKVELLLDNDEFMSKREKQIRGIT